MNYLICYYNIGNIQKKLGNREKALKEFKNCLMVCNVLDKETILPFTDGITIGVLEQATNTAISAIEKQ